MHFHIRRSIAVSVAGLVLACAPPTSVSTSPSMSGDRRGAMSDPERARHVLSRFTFGVREQDVATVQRIGVDKWIDEQLAPQRLASHAADSVLDLFDISHKTSFELNADHPQANEFPPSALDAKRPVATADMSAVAKLAALRAEADVGTTAVRLGITRNQAVRELPTSLVIRAVASDRQLLEVMTAFWENHFSVSTDKMPNPFTLVDYDRTIREHALGKFKDLLEAVAKSPAMLFYLDNYQSAVDSLHPMILDWRAEQRRIAHPPLGDTSLVHTVRHRALGLNENYARELMELHTLGVDGGYTQRDVQEVARCLTGWSVGNPQFGGTFLFNAQVHDAGDKTVLGVHIPGGRGIEDGEQVLDILAHHPSTARFIARKLATHFVSDEPPQSVVDRLAKVYENTDGDISAMIRALVASPEFNDRSAYRAKVKTPFELVASLLRVTNAAPDTTQQIPQLIGRLGQPIFGRQTPDGWPDNGAAWMNTGALLNRINVVQQATTGQAPFFGFSRWEAAERKAISSMPPAQQVDVVISMLLAGQASPETRQAMAEVSSPPNSPQHFRELVAIALGSSDFQRR